MKGSTSESKPFQRRNSRPSQEGRTAEPFQIGQFRIPGGTGASGVKSTKVRLMRVRNESTRAVAMANHHCFAFNCTKKKQKNI